MKKNTQINYYLPKKWQKKLLYFFCILIIYLLIIRKIYFAFRGFDVEHGNFLGDFFHMLSHVKYFMTGQDYSSWTTDAYDTKYLPVFPGLTIFFLPFVFMKTSLVKVIVIAINIIFPYMTMYPISKAVGIPYTWKFWQISKENLTTLFLFMILYYTQPYTDVACYAGQITCIVVFLTYLSLFSSQGSYLGIASGLKFSLSLSFFPLLWFTKQYKEVMEGLLILALILLFPILFYHDLWNLYLTYFFRLHQQLNEVNGDTLLGCAYDNGCIKLLDLAWFKEKIFNDIIKGFLAFLLFYGYWKVWKTGFFGLQTLLLVGGATLLMAYHRSYDAQIIVVPQLMILISIYKTKHWKMGIYPALLFACYLIPQRYWLHFSMFIGSFFLDNIWSSFKLLPKHPIFPLDAVHTFLITLLAFKRLWCDQEIYSSWDSTKRTHKINKN